MYYVLIQNIELNRTYFPETFAQHLHFTNGLSYFSLYVHIPRNKPAGMVQV